MSLVDREIWSDNVERSFHDASQRMRDRSYSLRLASSISLRDGAIDSSLAMQWERKQLTLTVRPQRAKSKRARSYGDMMKRAYFVELAAAFGMIDTVLKTARLI
jgi:hypothetical protein